MYNQFKTEGYVTGCNPSYGKFHGTHYKGYSGHWGGGFRRPKYNVPVNIVENEDNYEVYVYALNFAKENIKINVSEGMLIISGSKQIDENNKPHFIRQEYPIGVFERSLYIGDKVDTSAINARHENGVLIVTLPKTPEARQPEQEITIN